MKLICAPMATLCHPAFRILIEQFGGCDEYYTEMINAASLVNGGKFEKYYIDPSPSPQKIVWQLTGKNSAAMARAAEMVAEKGGIGVDLNMGCSAPEIYSSGAGIAWMIKPVEETRAMVREVKSVLLNYSRNNSAHVRLSVKLRLGDEDFTDDKFFNFCDMLVEEGAEQLALHPRTRKEKYRAKPRRHYAEQLALRYEECHVPVIVNGDIKDTKSADEAAKECPHCAGIMIGRAAVQKPWIFSEIHNFFAGGNPQKIKADLFKLAFDFIDSVQEYLPPEFWKTRLQRFFSYYCSNFSFAHYAETQFLNAADIDDLRERIRLYFDKVPEDRYI